MPKSHMAASLADHDVSNTLKHMDQTVGGNAARELHAASTEINSSLT
jgi:hypothetical protein